ncbi:hypothetical protein MMC26_004416 [Xylographa opegraphella]|nr:hypothetical protein [Xylographa opegraphella]
MSNKTEDINVHVMETISRPFTALNKTMQRKVSKAKCTGKQIVRAILPSHPLTLQYWQRRRALSKIPLPISTSRLLTLPAEIRQMIFALVLGNCVLHLTCKARWLRNYIRLVNSSIKVPFALIKDHRNWAVTPYYGISGWCIDIRGLIFTLGASEKYKPLALLRTCRAIYIEAIRMIYTTNIIDLDYWDFAELNYLSSSIGPLRLASITSLQMHCNVWFDLRNTAVTHPVIGLIHDFPGIKLWREVWQMVAEQMPGLRSLVVRLLMSVRLHPAEERELLRPIARMEGLKRLRVQRIVNDEHCLRSETVNFRDFDGSVVDSRRRRGASM